MDKREPLRLALCADDRFSMPLAACARSALSNFSWKRDVELYVFSLGIDAQNRAKIEASIEYSNLKIHWFEVDDMALGHLKTSQRLPTVVYLRFLIPDLLKESIEKIIYLDCDTIVQGDLEEIWNRPLNSNLFLATQDTMSPFVSSVLGLLNYRELNLSADTPYFNSGVMLLNLRAWRIEGITQKVVDYIEKNPHFIRWADQDGLNALYSDRWENLGLKWNVISSGKKLAPSDFSIIHFATYPKPWDVGYHNHNKVYFFNYLDQTSWKGYRVPFIKDILSNSWDFCAATYETVISVLRAKIKLRSRIRYCLQFLREKIQSRKE